MKEYIIDVEDTDYRYMVNYLNKRKNTEVISHGRYHFCGPTYYYQIRILTSNVGKLPDSVRIYGMVDAETRELL